MNCLKLIDGQPSVYSITQLRRDNPQTSFPSDPSDDLLMGYGVFAYTRPEIPVFDWFTETVTDGGFEQGDSGNWVQPYVVNPLSLDDIKLNVRNFRNRLLSETDWMALSDVVMSAPWAAYRQALRDITAQVGFPYGIAWPVKPE
jgi:hypothetical protein